VQIARGWTKLCEELPELADPNSSPVTNLTLTGALHLLRARETESPYSSAYIAGIHVGALEVAEKSEVAAADDVEVRAFNKTVAPIVSEIQQIQHTLDQAQRETEEEAKKAAQNGQKRQQADSHEDRERFRQAQEARQQQSWPNYSRSATARWMLQNIEWIIQRQVPPSDRHAFEQVLAAIRAISATSNGE
jgi:hypothetical protein